MQAMYICKVQQATHCFHASQSVSIAAMMASARLGGADDTAVVATDLDPGVNQWEAVKRSLAAD